MLYFIYFIICIIKILNAIIVESENDLINNLSESYSSITLNINSEIDITNDININNSIKIIYIIGNTLDSAILNLKYPLYFGSSIEEIKIKNVNINGNLFFKKSDKKITIDTVNLNGYIDSDINESNNNYIEITNLNYKPTEISMENCINLSGNIKISKSNFFGNSSCRNRLLHYNGFKKYELDIKESNFNGEYKCPFLSIENALSANIETSYFEEGYSSKNIDGGAVVIATYSNIKIQNCTFNDILSYNDGGAFNFNNNIQIDGSNLNFNNVTSLRMGSILQISSDNPSELNFNNITQQNTGHIKNMRDGGLIMNIKGQAKVNITLYHGENLINNSGSGSAFVLSDYAKLTVNNMFIKNLVGCGVHDGLFYYSQDSLNVEFNAYNLTLYNLYQSNKHKTSIFYFDKNNFANIDGLILLNSGGYNTNFLNILENSLVNFSNFEVDYFKSKTAKEFVNFESYNTYYRDGSNILKTNNLMNCKISNIISQGVLFRVKKGNFDVSNCEFRKIHECYKYNNCTNLNSDRLYVQEAELVIAYEDVLSGVDFSYVNIDQIYGDTGILTFTASAKMVHCNVSNSYFKNGFLHMDESNGEGGIYRIFSSTFENNTSEYGTIFNIPYTSTYEFMNVNVNNSTFTNNTASKFGGVIYSIGENNIKRLSFKKCNYNNNYAKLGNIIYGHSKYTLPNIGYNLKKSDVSTIPTYFEMYGNIVDDISILSGESIPEGIMFKLYDDYGNQMYFPQETSNIQFEDLVLFSVEVNDTYNARVIGQTKNYCWDEVCKLPPVKVVGNPGVYTLSLNFKSYGIYPSFAQDTVSIEIKILECDETVYLNQAIGNTNLKSCYIPKCEFDCNYDGQCVNNDLCDCSQSNFKGKYCNERVALERYSTLDILFNITALEIIFVIVMLIVLTIYFKNHAIIKGGGGFEFMIIILIGLLLNIVNAIVLTFKKTTFSCYQTYLFSNTGFSFVFGSIFVRSYRIYEIFCQETKLKMEFKRKKMFLIIALMTLIHWMMALWWYFFNGVNVKNDYTIDEKEFVKCEYHQSKIISSLFNFLILAYEFVLSYSIRRVEEKYKEDLVIPAYVYILYILIMYVVGIQDVVNVVIKDYFDIVGTIINTAVSIYFLFIIKFLEIYNENRGSRYSYSYERF